MNDNKPREKKSWREIDAQRDRSQQSGPRRNGDDLQRKLGDASKSKQYRAALDALFEKGGFDKVAKALGRGEPDEVLAEAPAAAAAPATEAKEEPSRPERTPVVVAASAPPAAAAKAKGGEERATLRKKIVEGVGRDEISRAVDKYLTRFPLPDDWEVLEQALEHLDEARVDDALGVLEALVGREKPRRARTLMSRLRYLEETSHSSERRERAGKLRAKLG